MSIFLPIRQKNGEGVLQACCRGGAFQRRGHAFQPWGHKPICGTKITLAAKRPFLLGLELLCGAGLDSAVGSSQGAFSRKLTIFFSQHTSAIEPLPMGHRGDARGKDLPLQL